MLYRTFLKAVAQPVWFVPFEVGTTPYTINRRASFDAMPSSCEDPLECLTGKVPDTLCGEEKQPNEEEGC